MDNLEDHIKYEAEESQQLTDHVWEEVVIEDSDVPTWRQDLEMDDGENQMVDDGSSDPATENVMDPASTEKDLIPNNEPDLAEAIKEEPVEEPPQPVVTSVTSLAKAGTRVNFNNLKILPKGSFINIGNKKMKLVTLPPDKRLIGGKIVTVVKRDQLATSSNMLSLDKPHKVFPGKVLNIPAKNNTVARIVNNNVPAKMMNIGNTKLKPIAPNNKEVTIYITGLAGDKVQIRDSPQQVNKLRIGEKLHVIRQTQQVEEEEEQDDDVEEEYEEEEREEGEVWKSDHIDACLPTDETEEVIENDTEMQDGHFLLEGDQSYDPSSLVCHICNRQFSQLKYLLSHQQTHVLAEPVYCELCGKAFKRRFDLLRHKRRAHADDCLYQCDICHKMFNDEMAASRHRITHSDDFKYCCEVCSRPFRFVHDLKRHRSIHFDEKPFDCDVCGKKFKHKSNLKTHQATHYSEKPYKCSLCDKRFHQKGNLKTHLIVHTGEMPFVCSMCTKRFHTRSGLLNHSYSHSEEKPFQCDICDKTFNWKSGLLTHQQTHQRARLSQSQGQQMLRPLATQHIVSNNVEVIEIGPIPVDN